MKRIPKNNGLTAEMIRRALDMIRESERRYIHNYLSGVTAKAPEVVDISWKGKIVGIDKKLKIRRKVK